MTSIIANDYIIPMLDARRMEVYGAVYDSSGSLMREIKAEILEPDSFSEFLNNGSVVFVGNGAEKFKVICQHPNATFINRLPSSKEMGSIANAKFKQKEWEDVAYFEPFYLKDFIRTGS